MPLAVERLTPDSPREAIQQAISESVAKCMEEGGRTQEQCVAIAISMAKRKTGNGSAAPKIMAGLEGM